MVDDSTNINKTNYHPPKSLKTKKATIYSLAWHWIAKKRWRIKKLMLHIHTCFINKYTILNWKFQLLTNDVLYSYTLTERYLLQTVLHYNTY